MRNCYYFLSRKDWTNFCLHCSKYNLPFIVICLETLYYSLCSQSDPCLLNFLLPHFRMNKDEDTPRNHLCSIHLNGHIFNCAHKYDAFHYIPCFLQVVLRELKYSMNLKLALSSFKFLRFIHLIEYYSSYWHLCYFSSAIQLLIFGFRQFQYAFLLVYHQQTLKSASLQQSQLLALFVKQWSLSIFDPWIWNSKSQAENLTLS